MKTLNFLFGFCLMGATSLSFALSPEDQVLINRIKPLGSVRVEGSNVTPATKKPVTQATARTPEQIYMQHCNVCHASGVAGAPKFHNKIDWEPRLKKGLPVLIKSVTNGFNAMPPMGTCQDCTQEEFKQVIEYMSH